MKTIRNILLVVALNLAFGLNAYASRDPDQKQEQDQKQYQDTSVSVKNAAAGGSAVNEGNELSVNTQVEAPAPDVVLIPNNNTERCLRVFGLSFSNQSGGGGIGFPWRSAKCDFEQAADDAFAAGERDIGWFWKCQNANLYKQFRSKDESKESAKTDCQTKMTSGVSQTQMVAMLKEQLDQVQAQREQDLADYHEKLSRYTEDCNESKGRIAETCRNSK